jgi:cell division cycle 14
MASVVSANDWLSSKGFKTYSFHEDKVQYVALPAGPPAHIMTHAHFFSIDNELVYWNFFLDFGPLNLGQLFRFCTKLNGLLCDPHMQNKTIFFYSKTHPHNRTNAATLICMWAMIYLNMSPDEAFKPFRNVTPKFAYFHDATPIACTYNLSVYDCLCGLAKALHFKFFDFNSFNVEEYEHYEQVECYYLLSFVVFHIEL